MTGYIDAPAGQVEEIAVAFEEQARLSRLEPGCELFEFTRDTEIPSRFHVRERYRDAAALKAHKARVAASDWAKISVDVKRALEFREE